MSDKKATHRVVQSGLYFKAGKLGLDELEVGSHLVLSDDQAERMEKRGFVESLKKSKTVDVSEADTKDAAKAKADAKKPPAPAAAPTAPAKAPTAAV